MDITDKDEPLELPEQVLSQWIDKPISQSGFESMLRQLKKVVLEQAMKGGDG